MAQGGHYSGLDEDENEDIEDFVPLPFMDPFILGLKKEGDEKFQAKQYQEAAAIYTMAVTFPIAPFMDISVIAEKLFRKRATCFFNMGKYLEAMEDSAKALKLAERLNNRNLVAKCVFINMKALVCLEGFIEAFPLAVWCKHLRPNCEKTKTSLAYVKGKLRERFQKDNYLVREVLVNTMDIADLLSIKSETRELALASYTELLDLLDFMLLPGALLKQAECLLRLGRGKEAKDICANVLWLRPNDLEALELMAEITQCLKERELELPNDKKKKNEIKRESPGVQVKATAVSTQHCHPSSCTVGYIR